VAKARQRAVSESKQYQKISASASIGVMKNGGK